MSKLRTRVKIQSCTSYHPKPKDQLYLRFQDPRLSRSGGQDTNIRLEELDSRHPQRHHMKWFVQPSLDVAWALLVWVL